MAGMELLRKRFSSSRISWCGFQKERYGIYFWFCFLSCCSVVVTFKWTCLPFHLGLIILNKLWEGLYWNNMGNILFSATSSAWIHEFLLVRHLKAIYSVIKHVLKQLQIQKQSKYKKLHIKQFLKPNNNYMHKISFKSNADTNLNNIIHLEGFLKEEIIQACWCLSCVWMTPFWLPKDWHFL